VETISVEVGQMFWKKKSEEAPLNLKCQADGCTFACHDYMTLQKHIYRRHPGFKLRCKADGCSFECSDYATLERHTAWKHPAAKGAASPGKE